MDAHSRRDYVLPLFELLYKAEQNPNTPMHELWTQRTESAYHNLNAAIHNARVSGRKFPMQPHQRTTIAQRRASRDDVHAGKLRV